MCISTNPQIVASCRCVQYPRKKKKEKEKEKKNNTHTHTHKLPRLKSAVRPQSRVPAMVMVMMRKNSVVSTVLSPTPNTFTSL